MNGHASQGGRDPSGTIGPATFYIEELDFRPVSRTRDSGDSDNELLSNYFRKLDSRDLLSREQEVELAKRRDTGDREALGELVVANLKLVVKFAKAFNGRGLDFEDLIQEGNLGLLRAAQLFDPSRGTRFSTYASRWILQFLSRAVDNKARSVRLPVNLNRDIRKLNRIAADYSSRHGTQPTSDVLEDCSGLSAGRIERALLGGLMPVSLNQPIKAENVSELGDLIADASGRNPESMVEQSLRTREVESLMSCLSDQERELIIHRFGLYSREILSYEELAKRMNTSTGSLKRKFRQAMERMRRMSRLEKKSDRGREPGRGRFAI